MRRNGARLHIAKPDSRLRSALTLVSEAPWDGEVSERMANKAILDYTPPSCQGVLRGNDS